MAEHVVGFHHQIGVQVVQSAGADPALVHRQRGVRRGHRQVEEERLPFGGAAGDVAVGGAGERRQELLEVPVGHRRTRQAGQIVAEQPRRQELGRRADRGVVLDEAVGRPVGHVDAKIVVEAARGGATRDRARKEIAPQRPLPLGCLEPGAGRLLVRVRRQEILVCGTRPVGRCRGWSGPRPGSERPVHPEMPLADSAAVVAVALQQLAHRESALVDQRQAVRTDDALLQGRTPVVAAGQHAVAGRGAHRRAGVRVPAHHPLTRQPVELRRGDSAARIEARHVAIPHVIDQKIDDVRLARHRYRVATAHRLAVEWREGVIVGVVLIHGR